MKNSQKLLKAISAFTLTSVLLILVYYIGAIYPFGDHALVMNHQFNWWFDYAPIRGLCLQRLKGGCLKHLYRPASKRGYLLVSSLFDSSFCC